jgi:ATP-dependent helicase/nuclease subunit A
MNYTREQQLALNYDRHIAVSANAGSGKTRILVDRYLNIIKDSYEGNGKKVLPYNVVALTFTKKAAAEMRSRLIKNIEKDIAELHTINHTTPSKENRERLYKYNEIRRRLSYARVQTIHSFANDILRDFPIEAGLNPNFSELTAIEKNELLENAVIEELEVLLEEQKEDSIIRYYPVKKIQSQLLEIISSEEKFTHLRRFFKQSDEEIEKLYMSESLSYLVPIYNGIVSICKMSEFEKAKPECLAFIDSLREMEFNEDADLYGVANLLDFAGFRKHKIGRKTLINHIAPQLQQEFPEYNLDDDKELSAWAKNIADKEKLQLFVSHSREYFNIAQKIFIKLDDIKSTAGKIDFDDMIIKLNNVLDNENVSRVIRNEIDYLLVDEFQDTNQLQYDIIKKLVPSLSKNHNPEEKSPKLFIVGDDKQSIYGFRSSDVRVFKGAINEIREKQNIEVVGKRDFKYKNEGTKTLTSELEGFISLDASFRMAPVPAGFVNLVFGSIMRETNEFEVNYSDLIIGKNTLPLQEYILEKQEEGAKAKLDNNFGKSELLVTELPLESSEFYKQVDKKTLESHSVARRILSLIEDENYSFGDITVLSRTSAPLATLYSVLIQYKIPVLLEASKDFYRTREIQDMLSILKFLVNTGDDLAFASTLKAPFFNFDDTDLFNIVNSFEGTLWQKFQKLRTDNTEEIQKPLVAKIQRAYEVLNDLVEYASKISIIRLINTIVTETDWYKNTVNFKNKEQIYANIEKFTDLALQYTNIGFNNIYDFISEVEQLGKIAGESEEKAQTADNAVTLMTIHASKGLEFPVVILMSAEKEGRKARAELVSDKFGLSYKHNTHKDRLIQNSVDNASMYLSKRYEKQKEDAELKRLLYVALTRAEKHIIISFPIVWKEKKDAEPYLSLPKTGFMQYFQYFVNSDLLSIVNKDINFFGTKLTLLVNNKYPQYDVTTTLNITRYDVENDFDFNNIPVYENQKDENDSEETKMLQMDHIFSEEQDFQFSATKINKFQKSPVDFGSTFLLDFKIDEEKNNLMIKTSEQEETDHPLGTFAGTVIHEVMERLNDWYSFDTREINEDLFEDAIKSVFEKNLISEDIALRKRINEEIRATLKTKLFTDNSYKFADSISEYELIMPFGNDFLTGKIDMLIADAKGNYEVWDWKSNALSKKDIKKTAGLYKSQMQLYAYFISLLHPEQENIETKLIFTRLAKENSDNSDWTYSFNFSKEELAKYEQELFEIRKEIKETYWMKERGRV